MSYTIENYNETFNDYKDILPFMRNLLPKCPIAQKYKDNISVYVKSEATVTNQSYLNEVKYYNELKKFNVTPNLIDHALYEYKIWKSDNTSDYYTIYYNTFIVTQYCGISLLDKYYTLDEKDKYGGPGSCTKHILRNYTIFGEHFFKVPNDIKCKVMDIITLLFKNGYSCDDIHPGNFLEDEHGIIRLIDLESISKI